MNNKRGVPNFNAGIGDQLKGNAQRRQMHKWQHPLFNSELEVNKPPAPIPITRCFLKATKGENVKVERVFSMSSTIVKI